VNAEFLRQNWGLLVAAGLLSVVALLVAFRIYRGSRSGRLRAGFRAHRAARSDRDRAQARLATLEKRLAGLRERADAVSPRDLTEAEGRVSDARSLLRIADDRLLVTANKLRKTIFEEFPPARHEALRQRYLPGDAADGRPFSF